jgi:exonuclease SbcC
LENTIGELKKESGSDILNSLKQSLKDYRKQASKVLSKKTEIEDEMQVLSRQEQNFIEFKTYLANTKIEALSKITNEFLENIGSDIRIRFSGYTLLKSGKVREKISVSLVRSGLDSGSFGKFSAGEAARVNLATILAMQKLINGNCETDKGLDLLVLDEILEAVDEEGLASMFSALNNLSLTALVVSHGNIAESYPYTLKIVKENGESRIEI